MNAILRWILGSWASAQNVVLGKVDAAVPAVPDAVSEACANAKAAMSWIGPVAYLVPWSWVGIAFGVVVVGITAAIAIKIIRIVASYATAGGGSAG